MNFLDRIKAMILNKILGPAKGYKTIIIGAAGLFITGWDWLNGSGLYEFLCPHWDVVCDITKTQFYMIGVAIQSSLMKIMRFVSDTPIFSSIQKK